MHDTADKDIHEMLAQAEIPKHSPDLPQRIVAAAMAEGYYQHSAASGVKTGHGFSAWWGNLRAHHGPKLAIAASLAAVAIIIFDPAGTLTEHYIAEQEMAANEAEAQRYTVDGVPLLADISLVEEPDLQMDMALANY